MAPRQSTIVLDGGMGDELRKKFPAMPWDPFALEKHSAEVVEMHCDYIRAGAQVIESWNYSVTEHWLRAQPQLASMPPAELHEVWDRLTRLSVRLARQAVDTMGAEGRVRVAGALPPLGASFDSEVPTDLLTAEPVDIRQSYLDLARVLKEEGCDIFLIETCATLSFAEAAVSACREVDASKALWLSFTLQNTVATIWSGETLPDAVALLSALPGGCPDAIMFNCTAPEIISKGLAILRPIYSGMIGGYGNSRGARMKYGSIEAKEHGERGEVNPARYAQWAQDWVDLGGGAAICGGCCGVGPAHIAALVVSLAQQADETQIGLSVEGELGEEVEEVGSPGMVCIAAAVGAIALSVGSRVLAVA